MNLPDPYRFSISLSAKLVCGALCTCLFMAGTVCAQSPSKPLPDGWSVIPNHLTVNCLETNALSALPQPQVKDISGEITGLSSEDQYFSLASASKEWTAYFSISRWETIKVKGDGGVDVTGAPNAILVEGANSAQVRVEAQSVVQFQIVIPADGFIAFDYENFGGSNLLNQLFTVRAGASVKVQKAPKAKFFSTSLHRGDVLTLSFDNATDMVMNLQINNLRFFTNAAGVWERRWTATNAKGESIAFPQYVTISKASIADVLFPGDVYFDENGLAETPICTDPVCTGYPFIDQDGNLATTFDRVVIDRSNCDFLVSWSDDLVQLSDKCVLERHWTISDRVSDNVFTALQSIALPRCPETGDGPAATGMPKLALPDHALTTQALPAAVHKNDL